MEINVNKNHIEKGIANNEYLCPVGLALREATGHDWIVDEFDLIALSPNKKDCRIYDTPSIVRYFIRKFDNQNKNKKDHIYIGLKNFDPFKFYLNREHSRFYHSEQRKYYGRKLVKKWGLI